MDIEDNKKKAKITRIVPGTIFVMMAVYVLFTIIPYIGSYALRWRTFNKNQGYTIYCRQFVKKRIKNVFDGFIFYNGRTRLLKQNSIETVELNITGRMYPENIEDEFTSEYKGGEISMICEQKKIGIQRSERRTAKYVKPAIKSYILEANKNNRNLPSIEEVSEELNMS